MTIQKVTASASGCSGLLTATVSAAHGASTATAVIQCMSAGISLGDAITVVMGYSSGGGTNTVFRGYVKQVERKIPDDVYVITAKDVLIRAVDYFVASTDPNAPFTRSNIAAEDLVDDVLGLAGLGLSVVESPGFIFGTGEVPVEVNLVGCYDYCKGIADFLAWHLYANDTGGICFVNRKPYPMSGSSGQPGDTTNEYAGGGIATFDDDNILDISYGINERDLRNRVVVYGAEGIYAEAKAASPHLPAGFYKTIVLSTSLITDQEYAQKAADYNLNLYNRLTYECTIKSIGVPTVDARTIVTLDQSYISGINGNWYVYSVDHQWSKAGYTQSLVLRR